MFSLATLLPALCLCAAPAQEPTEAELVAGLAELRTPIAEGDWSAAREQLDALIAAHRGLPHGLVHLPAIEDALLAIEFGRVFQERELADLVSGELVDFKRGTGSVELRYTPTTMDDFYELGRGSTQIYMHPAFFSGSYKVRVRGPRYPTVNESAKLPVIYGGLGDEEFVYAFYGAAEGTGARAYYASAVLSMVRLDGESEELDQRDDSPVEQREPFDLRLEVSGSSVTAYAGKKKLLKGRAGREALGCVGFLNLPDFEEIELKGRIEPSWLQGKRDTDRERQRQKLEEEIDLEGALEGWLPLADVESFGFGDKSPKGKPIPAKDVRNATARARLGHRGEALELFQAALDVDPQRADVWYERTGLLMGMGRRGEALESLRGAIQWEAYTEELHVLNSLLLRAHEGPDWPEVFEERSEHYVVRSDMGKRVCVDAASVLESSYERFSNRLGEADMGDEPFRVYLFAGEAGYHRYARGILGGTPENTAGVYSPALGQLLIWNVPERSEMMQTVRHEGFHQYFDRLVGDSPRWLNEGLAEYYENADFTKGRSRQILPHPEHLRTLEARDWKLVELEEFVRQEPEVFYGDAAGNYAQAWLLVHYLQESGGTERGVLEGLIAELAGSEDSAVALEAAFEGVDYAALQRGLAQHLNGLR